MAALSAALLLALAPTMPGTSMREPQDRIVNLVTAARVPRTGPAGGRKERHGNMVVAIRVMPLVASSGFPKATSYWQGCPHGQQSSWRFRSAGLRERASQCLKQSA